MKSPQIWLSVVLVVLPWAGLAANDLGKLDPAAFSRLVSELDDDNYFVRERALDQLAAAGLSALPELGQALLDGSPEVAWRASAALEQIAIAGDEKQMQQVADLLKRMSHQKPALARIANELAVRQQWARHENAVAELRALGGRLLSVDGDEFADAFGMPGPIVVDDLAEVEVAMPIEAEEEPVEERGIFGAIRAIARAILPGIPDLDAPPEPIGVEVGGLPVEAEAEAPVAESPDVEIIGRAGARAPDVDVIEEAGPAMEAVAFEDLGMVELDAGLPGETGGFNGVSQIAFNKNWLGGDEGLAHLKHVKGLTSVSVEDARISDAALRHLEAVPTLRQLTLRGGQFTSEALRKWRKKRPDVQVWAIGPAMMGVGADMGSSPLVLNHIYPRSGAQEAGLATGDIVKRIDGAEIGDFADLMLAVFQRKIGDKIRVEFEREGKPQSVEVSLKARQLVEASAAEDDPFR